MKRLSILGFALFVVVSCVGGVRAETLKIGLVNRFKEPTDITVSSTGDFRVIDQDGRTFLLGSAGDRVRLKKVDGGIEVNCHGDSPATPLKEIRFSGSDADWIVIIPSNTKSAGQYRGSLVATASESSILLVNVVNVEDYIAGVLPSEMPADFHSEALKAQAVAARTYALSQRGRHSKRGFDLCDGTDCQLYMGASTEKASATKAVKETEGLIAVYKGKPISAMYCGDCGGTTADGGEPYLASVSDRPEGGGRDYCDNDGHCWSRAIPLDEFESSVVKIEPQVKDIEAVAVESSDKTSRAKMVRIKTESGVYSVPATKVRSAIGNMTIKSEAFSVKLDGSNVQFTGKGFGHGIGLCQRGANGLASSPLNYTYEQILKHYYTGIDIVSMDQMAKK